jgi:hypothetical protein
LRIFPEIPLKKSPEIGSGLSKNSPENRSQRVGFHGSRVADHWVTGFGLHVLSRVISGSRAHRRSHRRRSLVSSASPTRGSGSISLNSPDLTLNLSALSVSSLCSQLSLSDLPLNLSISLSHLSLSVFG